MLRSLFVILSCAMAATTARADEPKYVDDTSLIVLNTDSASLLRTYSYPGYGHHPDGTNRYDVPDCLLVVTDGPRVTDGAQKLVGLIEVSDGPGLLGAGDHVNALSANATSDVGGYTFYKLKDLGTYLTGLRVRSKDGKPLREAVREGYGSADVTVALQVVRGCRLVPSDLVSGN